MKRSLVLLPFFYLLCCAQAQSLSRVISTRNSTLTSQSVTSRAHHPIDPNRGFSFVIPYNQTQECNIYGPICQTGSITVGVDLTSTTTTTIMPCSSYLTAQSSYLYDFNPLPGAIKPYWPFEWQEGFGHSPQCTSYADVWEKLGKFTFSNCGSNDAIVPASEGIFLPSQIPPGVLRQIPYQVYKCCGNCTLDVKEVRLYYFRDETESSNYCHGNKTLGSPKPSSTVPDKKQAIPGLNNSNSIATLSGYTFTSPSVYLEIVGTARITDSCGPLGAIPTNPIIALPPGVLSTYSPLFPYTIGEKYVDPNGVIGGNFIGHKKSLNVADLDCPTFGVGPATKSDGSVYETYGPPYLPIIIPPLEILNLDPVWKKICTDFLSYSPGLRSFAIFDPPRILTPAAALLPPSTPAPAVVLASKTPEPDRVTESRIQPSRPTLTSIPEATISVSPDPPLPGPNASVDDKKSQLIDPQKDVSKEVQPNLARTTASRQSDDPNNRVQNLGALILSAFGRGKASPGNVVSHININPRPPTNAQGSTVSDQMVTIVDSERAGNGGVNIVGRPSITNSETPQVLTIGGQIFTANPSIIIGTTTILPGSPEISISGTPISLSQSGTLFVNGSPINVAGNPSATPKLVFKIGDQTATANPAGFELAGSTLVPVGPSGIVVNGDSSIDLSAQTLSSNIFTVGGQTFTANPTGFALGSSTLLPGGAPIIISGTPISLDASGVLVIGSSSIPLSVRPPAANLFTAGGLTFTSSSSAIVVQGITLSPGGPAATISGTPIRLKGGADSNILIIGTSTINVPTPTAAANRFTIGDLTFTAQSSGIIIDGFTLVPGGPGATISGTPVSLETGGRNLLAGSRILLLPTGLPTATGLITGSAQPFEGGQGENVKPPNLLGLAGLIIVMNMYIALTVRCK